MNTYLRHIIYDYDWKGGIPNCLKLTVWKRKSCFINYHNKISYKYISSKQKQSLYCVFLNCTEIAQQMHGHPGDWSTRTIDQPRIIDLPILIWTIDQPGQLIYLDNWSTFNIILQTYFMINHMSKSMLV